MNKKMKSLAIVDGDRSPRQEGRLSRLPPGDKPDQFFLSLFINLSASTDRFALEFPCIGSELQLAWTPLLAFPQEVVDVPPLLEFSG